MNEQSKAAIRRSRDWRFTDRWLVGRGLDVGCGNDPLKPLDFSKITEVVPYDLIFGSKDARFLPEIKDGEFDFVHGSHVLEHVTDVRSALTNWLRVLRPGGFIVCSVPEEYLYEQGRFPSPWNGDHKFSFTLRSMPIIPRSIHVGHLLWKLPCDIEHLELLTEGFDPAKIGQDQTMLGAECAIEFVVKKLDPKKAW